MIIKFNYVPKIFLFVLKIFNPNLSSLSFTKNKLIIMKRKTLKLVESTLFVYKQSGQPLNGAMTPTDTTSVMTTTTHTTGLHRKNLR